MAKDQGISSEEIGAVQAIVMAVSAGRVAAQFREARIEAKQHRHAAEREAAASREGPQEE